MKWLTLLFAVFLVVIIALANTGSLKGHLRFMHELPMGDKIGHFVLIGIMALLMNLWLRAATLRVAGLTLLKGSVILAVIVTLEELSQMFIASRSFSWSDLVASLLGILVIGGLSRLLVAGTGSRPEPAPQ